jgi:uncharacterized protein YecT (DUF1311 family)
MRRPIGTTGETGPTEGSIVAQARWRSDLRVKCSLRPSELTVYHDVSGATDVDDLIRTVSQTPLPTILVLAGIAFWILAIAGSLAGKITIDPSRRWAAGAVGSAFVGLGLILFFISEQKATQPPPPAPPSPVQQPSPSNVQLSPPPVAVVRPEPPAPAPTPAANPPPVARPGPGVNCTGSGSPDEVAICGSATLAALDRKLFDIYVTLLKRLDADQQIKLKQEEAAWVKQRSKCQSNQDCLLATYKSRIEQLQMVP